MTETGRKIIYVQYSNPASLPPLEHSSRILADKGWQVLFLGTGTLGGKDLRFPHHPAVRVRLMGFVPGGWQQKLHYLEYGLWVIWWVLRWRVPWVYASNPLSCPIALLLSFLPGVRIIYHEHDSPYAAPSSWFMRLVQWSRKRLAHRVLLIVFPNAARADMVKRSIDIRVPVEVVWNCPSISEVVDSAMERDGRDLVVYYHGNISPRLLPSTILDAMAKLSNKVTLQIVGYETVGHKGYIDLLQKRAKALGIQDRVRFFPAMPRHELLGLTRQADVGLALISPDGDNMNLQFLVGASNKPFDYLASGLAIVVPDVKEWKDVYETSGYALACDLEDSGSIAATLNWFLTHRVETKVMAERGRQRILTDWNYERQFQPVLDYLYAHER